jgi:glutathione-specific gamma-glutamylcyclotransferase
VPSFNPEAEHCRWIFAYGSLMWNPGFEFERAVPASLSGFHRRLGVFSNHYRGSLEKPGLVLGLDRGGSARGLGYRIADANWRHALTYVRARELISEVYREVVKRIYVDGEQVLALTYVIRHGDPQCAPPMSISDTMTYVQQGVGKAGPCVDYVRNTLEHLRSMGIHDAGLEKLAPHLNMSGRIED